MNVLCPLCGKNCAESIFNPDTLDDDVYGVHVSGLGRGRGFAFSDRFSLLDPEHPVISRIRDRIRVLSGLLDVDNAEETMATQQRNADTSRVAEDVMEVNIELVGQVNELREQLEARDTIIEDLGEDSVNLKNAYNVLESDRDHRLQQATELLAIAKRQKGKIESLEEQVSDLSEEVIVG